MNFTAKFTTLHNKQLDVMRKIAINHLNDDKFDERLTSRIDKTIGEFEELVDKLIESENKIPTSLYEVCEQSNNVLIDEYEKI